MERIRSYYDADFVETLSVPSAHLTEQNKNELFCGLCGETVFVNDMIFDEVNKSAEETSENSFLCAECVENLEEAAHT